MQRNHLYHNALHTVFADVLSGTFEAHLNNVSIYDMHVWMQQVNALENEIKTCFSVPLA